MEITLKFPKTITVIMKYFKMNSVLQYITFPVFKTNITIKLKEDALKNQGKKPKKLFFWHVILSKPSRVLFKICLKNSATVVPPPAFKDKLHSILPYVEMLAGPENISNIPR